jgi:hypothetical protein
MQAVSPPTLRVSTPDGRTLTVREASDADGVPVFVLSGTPGTSGFVPAHVGDAEDRGFDRGSAASQPTTAT